jgi:3-oxoacyl-[acyl-carrier-protein] synthase-3
MPYVNGTGRCLPERVVTNEELAAPLGLTPEQIYKSSGILRRRWAAPGATASALAADALRAALTDAGRAPEDVDYLLFGTMTPDRFIPGSAPAAQRLAGLREIPCLDIRAACVNALYALQLAKSLINSGAARCVAICLAEIQSAFLDVSPASGTLSMLFGDGAAALVVTGDATPGALEIVDVHLAANGEYTDDLGLRAPGPEFGVAPTDETRADFFPRMNGQAVILHAGRKMAAACQELLQRNQLTIDDIAWLAPHQANANLLAQVARSLKFTRADGVVSVIAETANTSSASMGLALDELRRSSRAQAGDYLLMPAFGAGFTWGAGLCRVC